MRFVEKESLEADHELVSGSLSSALSNTGCGQLSGKTLSSRSKARPRSEDGRSVTGLTKPICLPSCQVIALGFFGARPSSCLSVR